MERKDNYATQAQIAKAHFLNYDQKALIRKFRLDADCDYLYLRFIGQKHRIHRETGDISKETETGWADANSFNEVLTIFDLLCDSREDRYLSGRWKSMQNFGLLFHTNLLENRKDSTAAIFDRDPQRLHRACQALNARPFPGSDIGYAIEIFDGLEIALQFWHGDEEFYPRLRYLWDENATMYIRYETMHYALPLVLKRLLAL